MIPRTIAALYRAVTAPSLWPGQSDARVCDTIMANLSVQPCWTGGSRYKTGGSVIMVRSGDSLRGKRVLITQCEDFMGPILCALFRAHGAELAEYNVHINLIAQNFVDNPTYFPPEVQASAAVKQRLQQEVPLQRLATPEEDALFAVFLASSEVNFFVGQSFPFAGGWVT